MSFLQAESHINISKPPTAVFEFVSAPANWPGLHPASKKITGDGINASAKVGTRFTEVIRDPNGLNFDAEYVVSRSVKDQFFEFKWPADYSYGPINEVVITYDLSENPDGSTALTRRQLSWVKPGVDTTPLKALYENDMHNDYVAAVKSRLEAM